MINIAVFASGEGTNAQNIIDYFKESKIGNVTLIVCSNPKANVLERAKNAGIPWLVLDKEVFVETTQLLDDFKKVKVDFIALAGFLWLIPGYLCKAFPNKIVNIHPALLPKYAGKGMYGKNIHKSVIGSKESESGISIHYVNEHYDEGKIILQEKCSVHETDTAETLAAKIHQLEYRYYPKVIESLIS
jgi:phosphoribosylglycinamide formyltransferase-1